MTAVLEIRTDPFLRDALVMPNSIPFPQRGLHDLSRATA